MAAIIRHDGFRVVIYSNDHLPAHVHIIKGDGEVRCNLGSVVVDPSSGEESLTPPSLIDVTGKISDKDVGKALSLVREHQKKLLDKWSESHDG